MSYQTDLEGRFTSLFADSPIFTNFLLSFIPILDKQEENLLWLRDNILDIELAEGFQLDFIGGLVGQSRVLIDFNQERYFGFKSLNGAAAYQSETFSSKNSPNLGGLWNSLSHTNTSTSRSLNDEEYRRAIKARIIYNNSYCTTDDVITSINLLLGNTRSTVSVADKHISVKPVGDVSILSYFISRVDRIDNILPLPIEVTISLREDEDVNQVDNTTTNPEPPDDSNNQETHPKNLLGVDTIKLEPREVGTLFYSRSSDSDAATTVTLTDPLGPIVASDTSGDFNTMFKDFTRYGYQVSVNDATEDEYADYIGKVGTSWVTKKVTISANDYSITLSVNSSNPEQGVIKLIPTEQGE